MSGENGVTASPTEELYKDAAQAIIEEVLAMRQRVPKFVIPEFKGASQRLGSVASLPPLFIQRAAVAIRNRGALAVDGGPDPDQIHDLMSYADAFSPVADEFEAMAYFIRHSVAAAKYKAGSDALLTYNLAQCLCKHPATADLIPTVQDMRETLGKRFNKRKSRKAAPNPEPETPPSSKQ